METRNFTLWSVLIIAFLGAICTFASFFTVDAGERAFIVRFGEIKEEIYDNGFHRKSPFIDDVVKMNVKNVKIETSSQSATKDLQDIDAIVAVNYSIEPLRVKELYKTVGEENAIQDVLISPAISESIKAAISKYTAEELITKRTETRAAILELLKGKLENRGITIHDINIINFGFSEAFNKAIEDKQVAEQNAIKAENDLKRIEVEAQQQIATSKAEAEKIKIQAEAIQKQGGKEYVQLQRISKRDGNLPQYVLGENTSLFMPMQ